MHDTLSSLVERAVGGNHRPLEFYLREHSRLPGPRANLELANDVAFLLASASANYPDNVRTLIHTFANGDRGVIESNTPSEFVMLCGVVAAGVCASVRLEWRDYTVEMLNHYSCNPSWRIREAVATAYQHLLSTDPESTLAFLTRVAARGNYLQLRAAISAVAEPRLLYKHEVLRCALQLQQVVLERVKRTPLSERKNEDFRVLRRTLGYTLSVVTAADPDAGFTLMRHCALWNDDDINWILRENLKKKRLAKFTYDTASIFELLS
jgi:hypothetical protein